MAAVTGTFVPTYQGLSAIDFVRPALAPQDACFPFNVPHRLPFYRARNAIYHLFRALVERRPTLTVLAPDYNSGNEILAMRAAGARIRYYPIDRDMRLDPYELERLCARYDPDLLYVIHYIGWAQPMLDVMALCCRRGMLLVEDCALSLLSAAEGRPLGSFGDWAVFCLYKTLPLPNGALLVQNGARLEALDRLRLREAGSASVLGRTAELLVQRMRGRASGVGTALLAVKRGLGRAAAALEVRRANVGDIGFNLDEVDLAMSRLSARLLHRLDFHEIRRRRVENYLRLDAQLDPKVPRVFPDLPDGTCPLFFPILVLDKRGTARALQRRGIDALEFWNESMDAGEEMFPDAQFLRAHVLELPLHQDLSPRQIGYMARQVSQLAAGSRQPAARAPQPVPARATSAPTPTSTAGHATPAARHRVERIEDQRGLEALQPEWNDLLRASVADSPFLTWEWQHAWSTHLWRTGSPHVLCVRAGDELIAVAPLMRRRSIWPRLEFLGTGHAGSDYLDFVVRRGREADALPALAGTLATARLTLRLDHVPDVSLASRLAEYLRAEGWTSMVLPGGICPIVPLAGHTWDSYLATLGAAHRANVRRRLRAIDQLGMRFEQVTTESERREALAALRVFHECRFGTHGGSTAFVTPALRAFHDEATRRALERGWLRMYVLRADNAPAAVMYGILYGRQFYFYQHGFDDRYQRHSLGLVVMAMTIRAAIREGVQTFDMLWGVEPYKWLWARQARTLRQIHLFPPHLGGTIQRAAVSARRMLTRLARRNATPSIHGAEPGSPSRTCAPWADRARHEDPDLGDARAT